MVVMENKNSNEHADEESLAWWKDEEFCAELHKEFEDRGNGKVNGISAEELDAKIRSLT